jgi:two-component system response regulator LytT
MLKVYIVDDEPLARDELKYLLNRSKQVNILGESDCIEDAIKDISRLKPDLVFLDIELEEENGFELAMELENLDKPPAIVFATAYDEYALRAFESNVIDYLLKPIDEDRLQLTLNKIKKLQKIGEKEEEIHPSVKNDRNEKMILVPYMDILYIESFEGKCIIKTLKQEYKAHESLVEVEKKLNSNQYLRVHRSYIVNLDQILEIEPWFNSTHNLIMKDRSKVPVSRTYIKELKRVLGF